MGKGEVGHSSNSRGNANESTTTTTTTTNYPIGKTSGTIISSSSNSTYPATTTLTTPEASKMLEAALLQIDGILSGGGGGSENTGSNGTMEWKDPVKDATRKLIALVQNSGNTPPPPDPRTVEILVQWMQPERLRKLENERSALHMEVSILSEQVETQSNKIVELESSLQEKKDSLRQQEESLQKEVLLRSALETQKLELLSSLSEMKLRQASLEHENLALRTAASPLTNGERFSRHAGHYSSLPRPPTSVKKGVAFANEKTIIKDTVCYIKPPPPKSFNELSISEISDWLSSLGLESYTSELKRWGATGSKLLDSSNHQLEKELDIKNALHRKKFLYAIESERCKGAGFFGSEKMDSAAVLRWLDDIGLPQHKEAFHNAKVDGRVLNRLTTEDLLILNVTAQLHAASLRRGIQVLRELNFEFDNLERRAAGENGHAHCDGTNDEFNSQVALWTNHRVMEWLRVVDLAEYAPNLRGSGVHGGLMVYEHRFTSELLATILSIPPAKTLLRRHLTTHFNQIVGREVVQQKREIENTLGFIPLTLTARLKVPKKANFTLKRKKSKNEVDFGNLVCPMEPSPPVSDTEIAENKRVIGCL